MRLSLRPVSAASMTADDTAWPGAFEEDDHGEAMRVSATPEILVDQPFEHPEGIVWDDRRRWLLWVDVFRGQVLSHELGSGSVQMMALGRAVGCVAPRRAGGLVCAVREGFGLLTDQGEFTVVAAPLRDTPHRQMNDGGVDAYGRFWAGSMTFDYETRPAQGGLYCLSSDGRTLSEKLRGINVSNGIGWSPDGRRCYYVDSATRRIDEFEFDVDRGRLGKRRTLAEVEAYPDGLAVDVDGCIWVAISGGWEVRRFTPSGRVDRILSLLGSQVTTCAFGGQDFRTLFIAVSPYGLEELAPREQKAGFIFAVDPGVQGLPTHEFQG